MSCRALISFALSRRCLSGTLPRCACLSTVVLFGRACLEPVGSRTGRLLIGLSMPLLAERPANPLRKALISLFTILLAGGSLDLARLTYDFVVLPRNTQIL